MSLLENLRGDEEDLEYFEKATAYLLRECREKPSRKVQYDTAIRELLSQTHNVARRVKRAYDDGDQLRKQEVEFLGGHHRRGGKQDMWTNFYDRIRATKEYHKTLQLRAGESFEVRSAKSVADWAVKQRPLDVIFAPNERHGKFVDLSEAHQAYINLKKLRQYHLHLHTVAELSRLRLKGLDGSDEQLKKFTDAYADVDYVQYLRTFDQFHQIPRHCKYQVDAYRLYVEQLGAYLTGFFVRVLPLADHAQVERRFEQEFEATWLADPPLEWKASTHAQPLYSRAADRLLATQGTFDTHANSKRYKALIHAQAQTPAAQQEALTHQSRHKDKHLAHAEARVSRYRQLLGELIDRTIAHVQKRQSRSAKELALDSDEAEEVEQDTGTAQDEGVEVDDEDKPVYNPLNLPLGWDGKPIPYWLYKLHGLGQEFKCEICGNYSYWGRKAFERHFSEWRHAFGMRCLKIPNTTHFREVTMIEDAVTLHERLHAEADIRNFKTEQEAECEDAEGNIMSARSYADLSRQGLL